MNEEIIKEICNNLNIKYFQVENTLKLLSEGATIPFIARYRKEATGNLDEEQIREITSVYEYQNNLLKRKEDVIRLIDEKGLLTEELKQNIMNASKLVEVEDIYRPFKEKKQTKATEAIKNGLEPLANEILKFNPKINELAKQYLNENIKSVEDAITGAKYIIAEIISDNASYRKWIRNFMYRTGILTSKVKKNAEDETKIYEMYYDFKENVNRIKLYRILAINRGEKEKILTVGIDINKDEIVNYIASKLIKKNDNLCSNYITESITDSLKRLILPSVEREIRSELSEKAEEVAISNFSQNLEKLLLQPPMKGKVVMGFDPAYRTGCKLAVIDSTGKVLNISVIYPHEPKNEYEKSKEIVLELINKYNVEIIAIGNGTASRESEAFIADVIKSTNGTQFIIVNEAGASVYSASKLAISEFPDLHVEERSAISIGRRLQDPLSELVKIDPKSIGVGLYQHDVTAKKLDESLNFVVTKAVNQVGVNVNTASPSLLKYVSGLTSKVIKGIIDYRDKNGTIKSREELKSIKEFNDKAYEQSIGFMRILEGENPLDKTSIHPESYNITLNLLNTLDLNINDIGSDKLIQALEQINIEEMSKKLNTDTYTLEDIVLSLKKPNRDPRDMFDKPLLKSEVLKLEDLKRGMKLQGTVRNVVDFGAFIDIGIKNDGLAHISKLTDKYIKHPSEVVSVGDIVDCYVDEIFLDKKKVSLSLKEII